MSTTAPSPAMSSVVSTLDTQSASLQSIGLKSLARQQQAILDIVIAAMRNGARDLSLVEIQQAYERQHGKRIDVSRVSARVWDLVNAQRLCRREDTRPCSITNRPVHPVYAPARQARLVA